MIITIQFTLVDSNVWVVHSPRNVGIHPEDWFKYGVTLSWNSTTPPTSDYLYNMFIGVQWVKVQVTGVSGTYVTGQTTLHYQNGTETTYSAWVDVETGDGGFGTFCSLNGVFIAANLGVGDATYTSQNIMIIDSTADRTYPGGARATNHAQGIPSLSIYWDKLTGAFVEMNIKSTYTFTSPLGTETVVTSVQLMLVDSGAWVVPEFSSMLLLALFTTLTLVAVVYKRKQLKTPTR
jgi:hypothetical protein